MNLYQQLIPVNLPLNESIESFKFDTTSQIKYRCVDNPDLIPPRSKSYLVTIVLDVDETLINARTGIYYLRPYVKQFLIEIRKNFPIELILWSFGNTNHVNRVLTIIDPDQKLIDFAIGAGESWQKKLLKRLKRDKIIIIDDSIEVSANNPLNSILIYPFNININSKYDSAFYDLLQVIVRATKLVDKCLNGEEYDVGIPKQIINLEYHCQFVKFVHNHPYLIQYNYQYRRRYYSSYSLDKNDRIWGQIKINVFLESYLNSQSLDDNTNL